MKLVWRNRCGCVPLEFENRVIRSLVIYRVGVILRTYPKIAACLSGERSVKCIMRWALGWKGLFPPIWEPIHGQFGTVGREERFFGDGYLRDTVAATYPVLSRYQVRVLRRSLDGVWGREQ
jgi:hypothetical protein